MTAVSLAVRLVSAILSVPCMRLVSVVLTVVIHVSVVAFVPLWALMCGMRGVLGRALPLVMGVLSTSTVFVVSAVLLARSIGHVVTMISMPSRGVVVTMPTVWRLTVVLSAIATWRFPVPKFSNPAVEGLDGLPGVLDRYPGLGRRDGAPQIRCPAALLGGVATKDHQ
ncbi:hypothetical protein [Streptomyces flaveus]|uniref:hypothetical protein n=1 Tax=Streptomyces flaveus TaxID=66370 RepID=UPI003326D20B